MRKKLIFSRSAYLKRKYNLFSLIHENFVNRKWCLDTRISFEKQDLRRTRRRLSCSQSWWRTPILISRQCWNSYIVYNDNALKSDEHLNKKIEKFRVRRCDAVHAQNGPINFHENAHIHRFEMLITSSFLKIS